MGDKTKISWSDATWNPYRGCRKVSEGCGTGPGSCYAIGVCHRHLQPHDTGLTIHTPGEGTDWTGEINRAPDTIFFKPLAWARPRLIFPTSLSDPFYEELTYDDMAEMWAVMRLAHWHTFQLLTKRSKRMRDTLNDPAFHQLVDEHADRIFYAMPENARRRHVATAGRSAVWPLPNVWCGVSLELSKYGFRAEHLRATPAAVRWISAEPLMDDLSRISLDGIDWVVVGGQSGPGAVRMDPNWARAIRDRCDPDTTAFHFKQTGVVLAREWGLEDTNGSVFEEWPAEFQIREFPRAS